MNSEVASRLQDLPPINPAGLLTTPSAEGRLALFRDKLDTLVAVPTRDGVPDYLILVTVDAHGGNFRRALESQIRALDKTFAVHRCSAELIALVVSLWETGAAGSGLTGTRTTVETQFDALLADAIRMGASDIHIERSPAHAVIRFRTHGLLKPYADWPADQADKLAQMLYAVAADADGKDTTYDPKVPQDSRIGKTIEVDGAPRKISIRFASMPVRGGNDVTLRLLPEGRSHEDGYVSLEHLGYEPSQIALIEKMSAQPVGAVILAGVTGSGKSTTLKSLLMWLDRLHHGEAKIRSIEDPPEYMIPGARQSPVVRSGQRDESGFAVMIRAAMRSDPDVIMIGEVRDPDTVELLIGATLSGHKVLCTLHTASANTVPARLFTINAKSPVNVREIIASGDFLSGAIYQKLLPVLCPRCSIPVDRVDDGLLGESLWERLYSKIEPVQDDIRVRGPGCSNCKNGIAGRTICAETVLPDYRMIEMYAQAQDHAALCYWRAFFQPKNPPEPYAALGGFALDHGIYKMRKGLLDPRDVELQLGSLDRFDSLPVWKGDAA